MVISTPVSCGGELNAVPKEQQFTSPGYATAYNYNQECTWKIKVRLCTNVSLSLLALAVYVSDQFDLNCIKHLLSIFFFRFFITYPHLPSSISLRYQVNL